MVITSYTFFISLRISLQQALQKYCNPYAVMLQHLCSNTATPMQYPISYEF